MPTIRNVAVFGATGNVGRYAVSALRSAGFKVTAIARLDSSASYPSGLMVKHSNYDDLETLTEVLRGQDAIVEAFNPAAAKHQATIVKAALAVGVSRIITPEFSTDSFSANAADIAIFEPSRDAQREIERLTAAPDCSLTWTAIMLGPWYDWAIENGLFWINKTDRTVTRFGSGNQKVSMNSLAVSGAAITTVLQNPDKYRNTAVYFAEHDISTNELIAIVEGISPPGYWRIVDVPVSEMMTAAKALWDKDTANGVENRLATRAYAMIGTAALFDEGNRYDGDFSQKKEPRFDKTNDELKENLKKLLELP